MNNIEKAYELAKQSYGELGVDTDKAMQKLSKIKIKEADDSRVVKSLSAQ